MAATESLGEGDRLYPYLIPGFPHLTTFGVMMVVGFFAGAALTGRSLEREGFTRDDGWSIAMWGLIGGIVGAKLWFVAENVARGGELYASLFSRGGLTWFGGFIGGVLFGVVGAQRLKIPLITGFNAVAPGLAVGQALGRVGCFLVGDDWGLPSDAPWAVAFPKGIDPVDYPVHPTQLYEVLWLLPVAWLLWQRRGRSPFLFAEYLVLAGIGRLWIEAFRKNPDVVASLTNAQLTSIALIALGALSWFYVRGKRTSAELSQ